MPGFERVLSLWNPADASTGQITCESPKKGGGEWMSNRMRGEPDRPWATLAQAIEGVRAELSEAMAAGEAEELRFDVGEVELEFTVEIRRDLEAKAGVAVWVVEMGGSGARSDGSTHRLKVTLHPVDIATGRSPRVADRVAELPPRRSTR
jgi:hypothetical protein